MAPVALGGSRRRGGARLLSAALLALAAATACVRLLTAVPAFIHGASPLGRRSSATQTARRAEGFPEPTGEKKEGGFMNFLNVEQDIELSPEEYNIALEQEIESQRKRYYIGGNVKPNNLIVPWKPVEEKQLEADARRQLKKNGISDPSGGPGAFRDSAEDSPVSIMIIGEQDVQLEWTGGEPGTKVGYIVERKRPQDQNFREIATYDSDRFSYLLMQPYAGHEFGFTDGLVQPGAYSYRVLVRFRSGEISVVDQKDVTVPELSGVDNKLALIVFLVILVSSLVGASLFDPLIT
eukprot:CAMPEP_0171217176 /NCGR_PEP_ID=MMETSP0790-20130122/32553_1 /TAXON_ID=2925 /ORGANISM="Alexandrium catenella, Strain OF101" /LENGTH=293 /DNA_ID=CAMNT_0011682963 /DNA_START=98 /DNA_END=979 /DNA_ORIENTATION=-